MEINGSELDLPGFRFHPTEEELLEFYLRRAAAGKKLHFDIIGTLNLYLHDPWDLPAMAKIGEREWYFFVPRDRRHSNGGRPNRTTERGFWKATGSDRPIRSAVDPRRLIGLKKTLVYYRGRAPRGSKTDWVMNEYRLPSLPNQSAAPPHPSKEDIVLCKVYRKATSLKELEHRAAMEEDGRSSHEGAVSATSSDQEDIQRFCYDKVTMKMEEYSLTMMPPESRSPKSTIPLLDSSAGQGLLNPATETAASRHLPVLPALQVPNHTSFDWVQDSYLSQLRSPWLDQWSPLYTNLLNF